MLLNYTKHKYMNKTFLIYLSTLLDFYNFFVFKSEYSYLVSSNSLEEFLTFLFSFLFIIFFKDIKKLLNKFKNVYSLCKSIETVTILTLHMFKNKITVFLLQYIFFYLKLYYSTFLFTDKSCSNIINNLL